MTGDPLRAGPDGEPPARAEFHWRLGRVALLALFAGAGALLLWKASAPLLLAFAGVLLAVLLRIPVRWLAKHRVPQGLALALVVLALAGLAVLVGWFVVPRVADQFAQLASRLPASVGQARQMLVDAGVPAGALERLPQAAQRSAGGLVSGVGLAVSGAVGLLVNLVIVLLLGIYFAASPRLYLGGLLRLAPPHRRPRLRAVAYETAHTLERWLAGRLVSMVLVGVLTWAGLALLGVPLPVALALVAALLNFVPYIGAIVSAVPALLLALTGGPMTVVWTAGLYVLVQNLDGYVFTPLVQRKAVSLPPALTLFSQVIAGVLAGVPGILVATPLAAAGLVVVRRLVVEDLAEHRAHRPDGRTAQDEPDGGRQRRTPAGRGAEPGTHA